MSVAGLPVVVRVFSQGMQGGKGPPGTNGTSALASYATKADAVAAASATPPTLTGPILVAIANDETHNYTPSMFYFDGTTFRLMQNWTA
jgi:hypothetical protein